MLTQFPDLATSGRHNSAMITDRQKFTTKLTLYGIHIDSTVTVYAPYSKRTYPNFRQRPI